MANLKDLKQINVIQQKCLWLSATGGIFFRILYMIFYDVLWSQITKSSLKSLVLNAYTAATQWPLQRFQIIVLQR